MVEEKTPYQVMPDLTEGEYQVLKDDIAQHGILVPVEIDEVGNILDGHHRIKAWTELKAGGINLPHYQRLVRANMSEAQKRNHARSLNALRRHLSKDQLSDQMVAMRQDGMTLQAIADVRGVSAMTVQRELSDSTLTFDKVEGKDGKERPAKYKPRIAPTIIALNPKEEKIAQESIVTAGDSLPQKIINTKRSSRIARESENQRLREKQKLNPLKVHLVSTSDIILRTGDFREVLSDIENDSVDIIFTDPPYGKDSLPLWIDLAALASRILKPGGWFISYSGQSYLNKVLVLLSERLTYVWMIAQINTGSKKTLIHHAKIYSQWKPLLLFVKPPLAPLEWVNDTINGGGVEKDIHEWQQSLSEAEYCIKSFTLASALVVDPFLGGGTTALAAKNLGRRFIGCDTDAAYIKQTEDRLNGSG